MAATFVNVETGSAFRVLSTEEARDLVPLYAPGVGGKTGQQLEAYRRMPDSVLFRVQQVRVPVKDCDLPGPTRYKAICSRCGQVVRDRREVLVNGEVLCKPCAHGAYFKEAKEITWPGMNWTPDSTGVSHEPHGKPHLLHQVEVKDKRGMVPPHAEIAPH
jgi:formylmethanofuran dehydrogenase subunit E